eukprot:CCRYP_004266-RA/>CCRYP_004266-RA protein AED:0.28 eAED:0.30 QI:0/0/0/1/0.5/0.2/5/0/277
MKSSARFLPMWLWPCRIQVWLGNKLRMLLKALSTFLRGIKITYRLTWSAYLETLPTRDAHFDPTPDFYSDAEIDELESPMIVNSAKEEKQQISDLSQSMVCEQLTNTFLILIASSHFLLLHQNISFDELQFATWLVSSRLFAIKISVDDPLARSNFNIRKAIRVLLPYLDMINHSLDDANAELHLIDPEKDDAWFAIRAVRPIKNGKEITISYGASGLETSAGLLMNYGFVPNQNKIDSLLVQKGGDGCIESLDRWKTTLDEDEAQLSVATGTWSMC